MLDESDRMLFCSFQEKVHKVIRKQSKLDKLTFAITYLLIRFKIYCCIISMSRRGARVVE